MTMNICDQSMQRLARKITYKKERDLRAVNMAGRGKGGEEMKERDLKERRFTGLLGRVIWDRDPCPYTTPRSTQPGTADGRKKAHWVTGIKTCQPQQPQTWMHKDPLGNLENTDSWALPRVPESGFGAFEYLVFGSCPIDSEASKCL